MVGQIAPPKPLTPGPWVWLSVAVVAELAWLILLVWMAWQA
jgi:hypothetical protein